MRRKIIRQGAGGATVFLPIGWVRKNSLTPGTEVEIQEKEGGLMISAEKGKEKKEIALDITGFPAKTIRHIITQAYCSGYTDVRLIFKTRMTVETKSKYIKKLVPTSKAKEEHRTIDIIYDTVRDLIGYEVVEHKENSAQIRQISKVDEDEFKVTLRRIYLLLQELNESLVLEMGRKSIDQEELYQKIGTFHRFVSYAVRLLKSNVVSRDNIDLHEIIMRLDYIADAYSYIIRFLTETQNKPDQGTINVVKGLGNLISSCYNCQYNFSYEKYNDFDDQLQALYYTHNSTYKSAQKPDIRIRQIVTGCYMELAVVMRSILAMNIRT